MGASVRNRLRLALLLCVLVLAACGGDDSEEETETSGTEPSAAAEETIADLDAEGIAAEVEEIRGEEFREVPVAEPVSSDESAEHFAEQVTELPPREALAAEEQLKLIGLIPEDMDLGDLGSAIGGDAALGFYESPPPRIALVAGPGTEDPKAAATVFAHEATHALDDQYFDIFERLKDPDAEADEGIAFSALVEGDATSVELAYAEENGGLPSEEEEQEQAEQTEDIPFAFALFTEVVYRGGAEFVGAITKEGGPQALEQAFEDPPVSSAQIIHPELYLEGTEPVPVPLDVEPVLGDGWNLVDANTYGELDVLSMLAFAEEQVESALPAAEGWAGGEVELWRKGPVDAECQLPCVSKDALIIGLEWSSPTDADEFETVFVKSIEEERDGEEVSGSAFEVAGGGVAVSSNGTRTTVAYAPSAEEATELAERSQR